MKCKRRKATAKIDYAKSWNFYSEQLRRYRQIKREYVPGEFWANFGKW
ncbi:MAG: hypothetical protein WA584_23635 [Pyrinomonadaceae bacterium]